MTKTYSTCDQDWLTGGGEMGALMRELDWGQTLLGPIEFWSPSLKMMTRFLLANRFPILLWWGPEFCQLYNDAYRPILGTKHPHYLGRTVRECWSEIWHILQPLIETPFQGGPATWMEDIELEINRYGFTEESHFTIAYSPVPDETVPSGIGGVMATVHEITEKVVGERRIVVLRDLGAQSIEAKNAEHACDRAAATLAEHPKDIPFALIYLIDPDRNAALLTAAAGVAKGTSISPLTIELNKQEGQAWPLSDVIRTEQTLTVEDLHQSFGDGVPAGPWGDPPVQALVTPIRSNIAHQLAGVLVMGISSRLQLDDSYRSFIELAAGQIATAVTNARAYEQERQRAEALAEIDRSKTLFFSNVSHEFRTPLTLLLGPLEDVIGEGNLPPNTHELLKVAHRNGQRLQKLVNMLLDFSRIEAGRIQASFEPVDLAALTTDLASVFRSTIEKAGLELVVDCPTLSEQIYVDREMWEKIVLNLVSNAFKFTFTGKITVSLDEKGGAVELIVRDTGSGIPATALPHLFERFYRVNGSRGRSYEGSGIGLALVAELAALHGGAVRVESELEQGSTFIVSIPRGHAHLPSDRLALPGAAATGLASEAYVMEASRWLPDEFTQTESDDDLSGKFPGNSDRIEPRKRILIADDNADMRDYLRRLVESGYTVVAVPDGEAALAAVKERSFDLVLTDVMMPKLDGFGLLKALRENELSSRTPVILLSARAGEESKIEGLAAGADDYLVKPFSARELVARVEAHLKLNQVRREGETALRASETKFASAFGQSPLALTLTSLETGRLVEVNERFVQLSGYTREEAIGRTMEELQIWVDPNQRTKGLERLLEGQCIATTEARFRTKDGRLLIGEVGVSLIEINSQPHVLSSVADITNRRRAEEALREADRRKDEFLATLAHELRNPLAPLHNGLQLVRLASDNPATMQKAVSMMERQLQQLRRLVDDLLDVSRISRNRLELRTELLDLASVIKSATETSRPVIEAAQQELQITLPAQPVLIEGDPVRLAQAFSNLLNNAAKYSEPGGTISLTVGLEIETVVIRVRDRGIGIPADKLSSIFDMFVQVDSSMERSQGGLGIGLTLVRQLIQMHGGAVEVQSDGPGQGSEFVVRLPFVVLIKPEQPADAVVQVPPETTVRRRIMVVDDNLDSADSLSMMLEMLGHEVSAAHDGVEAVETARRFQPEVAFLDVGMPRMNGYEAARLIRQQPECAGVILVALTGWGQEEDKRRSHEAGFDIHMVKPIDYAAVEKLIEEL